MKRKIWIGLSIIGIVGGALAMEILQSRLLMASSFSPLSLNPIAWLKLNGNATDETGNYNGSWVGTESYTSGHYAGVQAASFDGSSYITNSISVAQIYNGFTMCFWVKPTGSQSTIGILQFGNEPSSGTPTLLIQRSSPSQIKFYFYGGYNFTVDHADGTFIHLSISFNGVNEWILHVNGQYISSYETQINELYTQTLYIGNGYNGSFIGSIADVIFFDKVLSSNDISKIYYYRGN